MCDLLAGNILAVCPKSNIPTFIVHALYNLLLFVFVRVHNLSIGHTFLSSSHAFLHQAQTPSPFQHTPVSAPSPCSDAHPKHGVLSSKDAHIAHIPHIPCASHPIHPTCTAHIRRLRKSVFSYLRHWKPQDSPLFTKKTYRRKLNSLVDSLNKYGETSMHRRKHTLPI